MARLIVLVVAAACWAVVSTAAEAGDYEGAPDMRGEVHAAVPPPAPMACQAMPCQGEAQRLAPVRYFDSDADAYDDSQSHPLRLLAYAIHPIGYTLEWLVTRPIHEMVAQPDLEPVFGHEAHANYGESPLGSSASTAVRRTYVGR